MITGKNKLKTYLNVNINVTLIEENLIQIKSGITICVKKNIFRILPYVDAKIANTERKLFQ